jgi:hypothetical protein
LLRNVPLWLVRSLLLCLFFSVCRVAMCLSRVWACGFVKTSISVLLEWGFVVLLCFLGNACFIFLDSKGSVVGCDGQGC